MGRPNRDFTTDNRFHVINRAVDNQDLFSIDDDWNLFESLIGCVCDDYGFELNAYALMSNHYHFLADLSACEARDGISDAIGVLQSTYAKYFNERTGRRGPLFEPRFLSFGVAGETKTHRVIRYIHRNPIDICGASALGAYRWSSLPVYLGRRDAPVWLNHSLFEPQHPLAYLADLANCAPDDLRPLDALAPQRSTSLDAIESAVDGAVPANLDRRFRQSVTMMMALDLRAADVVEIAARFDRSTSQVRRAAQSARLRAADDPTIERLFDHIRTELARTD